MIFVDQEENRFDGKFGYTNKDGEIEFVKVWLAKVGALADINVDDKLVSVYAEDIPNLIKALQAAYNFWEKNNG